VDREIIRSSVELLGVDMDSHIQFVIEALKPHAEELGIAGKKTGLDLGRGGSGQRSVCGLPLKGCC
jgi:hypothetical protein